MLGETEKSSDVCRTASLYLENTVKMTCICAEYYFLMSIFLLVNISFNAKCLGIKKDTSPVKIPLRQSSEILLASLLGSDG